MGDSLGLTRRVPASPRPYSGPAREATLPRTYVRTYRYSLARSYVRTYDRTYVRTIVRTLVGLVGCALATVSAVAKLGRVSFFRVSRDVFKERIF